MHGIIYMVFRIGTSVFVDNYIMKHYAERILSINRWILYHCCWKSGARVKRDETDEGPLLNCKITQ